jgi:hypothetical protein
MRWLAALALTACATTAAPAFQTTVYGDAPSVMLQAAVEAARAQRFEVALVDEQQDRRLWGRACEEQVAPSENVSFVALPPDREPSQPAVAYVVHIVRAGQCRYPCSATVAVTPLGYRGDTPVPLEELPSDVPARAHELMVAISDRIRGAREHR